jgi:hypothetical protein
MFILARAATYSTISGEEGFQFVFGLPARMLGNLV